MVPMALVLVLVLATMVTVDMIVRHRRGQRAASRDVLASQKIVIDLSKRDP